MKILISGATGLIGNELGKALVAKGHQIVVLTRSKRKAALHCPFPHQALSWDELADMNQPEEIRAIVNLAGAGIFDQRWNKSYKQTILRSRVDSTQKLVEFANKNCPKLSAFVSTSGVGIYGEADDQPISEDHNLSYSFLGQVCQDWERPISDLKKSRGVILRVAPVFSEKGGALSELVPPVQMGYGGTLAGGQFFMSWIDVDDLVNMYIFAIENPVQGIFNACAPRPETNQQITQCIADHLDVSPGPNAPFFALRVMLGKMAHHLIESQTISPQKIMNKGFQFQYKTVKESIEKRVPKLSGTEKRKIFEQWIPKIKDEIFPFFAEARNLEEITPPSLNFRIISVSDQPIKEGTEINYKLKIDGIPVKWKTLIKNWQPPHQFVDNQEKGPYKKWHHTHTFEDLGSGTLMTDQIDLQLPLGLMGHLTASWKVTKDVNNIFAFRKEKIYALFNNNHQGGKQ